MASVIFIYSCYNITEENEDNCELFDNEEGSQNPLLTSDCRDLSDGVDDGYDNPEYD